MVFASFYLFILKGILAGQGGSCLQSQADTGRQASEFEANLPSTVSSRLAGLHRETLSVLPSFEYMALTRSGLVRHQLLNFTSALFGVPGLVYSLLEQRAALQISMVELKVL